MKDYTLQFNEIQAASVEVGTATMILAKAVWQLASLIYSFTSMMIDSVKAYYNESAVKPLVDKASAKVQKRASVAFNHVKEYAATAPSIEEVKGWVVSAVEKAQSEVKAQMGSPE